MQIIYKGYFLFTGVISKNVTIAALSSNIYLSNVTGIKGQDEEEFDKYLDGLADVVREYTKFDRRAGNTGKRVLQNRINRSNAYSLIFRELFSKTCTFIKFLQSHIRPCSF